MTNLKVEVETGEINEPVHVGVLKPYFFRTDEDGHDFFVPIDIILEFDAWLELKEEGSDEFYDHPGFHHLSHGGSFDDIKLFINPNDLK